ncbi:hypothetical protein CAP35_00685 [Chitinophagaceae bacterium IBVUCB1]|nr:hypothetical protein CAP35_00685 [Chitinophagaceae bacterium IBVUCB1]
MTTIRLATIADVGGIRRLAADVWWPTYSTIISAEQIRYMLGKMYNEETIKQQIETNSQTYLMFEVDGVATGFTAYSPRTENPDVYKLHKLYCLTHTKGLGYGKLLLQAVESAVLSAGKSVLELNVNRHNPAVGFYQKMGFEIAYTEDIDIGNGYWMNDYVMRKIL